MMNVPNLRLSFYKLVIIIAVTLLQNSIFAQSNPTAPAQGFSVFVKNSATLQNSQSQGPVAIGGDFNLSGNSVLAQSSAGTFKVSNLAIGLLIGGKVNYTSGNSNYVNNGYLKIGNGTGSIVWYVDNNGASSSLKVSKSGYNDQSFIQLQTSAFNLGVSASNNPVIQSGLIDFGAAFTTFQASSTCMSTYTNNASLTNPNGNVFGSTINSVLTYGQVKINLASGVNVLNVSGADLNNVSIFSFNNSPDASHILVVNVNAGSTYTWNVWNQSGVSQSNSPYIIYNFYNTTSLTISGNSQIEGTVFAPFADINKPNSLNIEGQVIANSLTMTGGSINYANFNYNLPACACSNPVVAAISGSSLICNASSTITLSDATTSGVWSSSNTAIATVSGGVVTAQSAGTATISYAVTNSCGTTTVTKAITVAKSSTSTTTATVCAGTSYVFNGSSYSSTGSYTAHLTNAAGCDSAATLSLFVIPMLTPSLSIASSATSVCSGVKVSFASTVLYAGENVTYQWNKNGVTISGATAATYSTTTASTGDVITCTITVGATCIVNRVITSNAITITLLDPGTWVGGVDASWSNPSNWCGAIVPLANTDVVIPVGATNYPTITGVYPVKNLTVQNGTTLTITGTLQVAGSITNNGVLDVTSGTIELNGTTAQTIPAGALKNNSVKNITINNAAGVALADSLKVTGTITPTKGTLTTNGKLVLKSSSTGTARIAAGTGNYLVGNVTVERYINQKTARRFNVIGSTTSQTIRSSWQQQIYVTGAGTGGVACGAGTGNGGATDKYNSNGFDKTTTNSPSIYTYNSTLVNGSRWVSVASTSENLVPGKGYRVNIRGNRNSSTVSCADQLNTSTPTAPENVTLSATGTITTGDVVVTLNDVGATKYSLLGNPYPSQISFTAFQASNSTKISSKMWSYSPYGNGNYTTYSAGIIANGATSYDNTNGDYIASGQAFFVEGISNGSVTFSESHKTNGTIPNTQYFGVSNKKLIRIALQSDSSTRLDEAVIRYNAYGSTNYIPEWDATSLGGGAQTLAIIKGINRLSIGTHIDSNYTDITKVGVKSNVIGAYQLSFSDFEGIDNSKTIILHDKYLGINTDVRTHSIYHFKITADTGSKGDNRFEVFVNAKASTLPVTFTSVKANKTETGAVVSWSVADEANVASYDIQRSTDGISFTTIAIKTAVGATSYSENDLGLPASISVYYRIKSVELAGEAKYSAIAKLNNAITTSNSMSIYPNPVKDQLNITISNATNATYTLKVNTITGKQILNKTANITNNGKINVDANSLPAGVYMVELTNANGVKLTEKFIKE